MDTNAPTNPQGLTVQQMSQAAANPGQFGLNPQGLTAQQMGQRAEEMSKTQTIQKAVDNPGQLQVGMQTGMTPNNGAITPTPTNFQAIATGQPGEQPQQPQGQPNTIQINLPGGQQQPQNQPGFVANPTPGQTPPSAQQQQPGGAQGAPGATQPTQQDTLASQLNDLNQKSDQAFDTYQNQMKQLQNGTFPLTADQDAQISSVIQTFQAMKDAQQIANRNYTRGMTQAGISSGRARYAPEIEMGNIQNTINVGLQKLRDIDSKMISTVQDLKSAFDDKNYKLVNDGYEVMQKHIEDKQKTISDMITSIQQHEDKMAELNQKAEKDNFDMMLKSAEFDQKATMDAFNMMMGSDKFDWEQKQDTIKNMMESDKFTYQQKQDNIKNLLDQSKLGLEGAKFDYEQQHDLEQMQLDLKKLESADTPSSYKEWKLAGQPGSYNDWLTKKVNAKPPTADQSQSATYATRMKDATSTIDALTSSIFSGKGGLGGKAEDMYKQNPFAQLSNPDLQRLDQAERNFVNAVLRKESGSAISATEFDSAKQQYFPQPGDTQAVIDQKKQTRLDALQGIANEAGSALSDEFKSSIGKTTYHSIDDYAKANPDQIDAIDKMGQEHPNWSDDDILQVLQAGGDGGDQSTFNQPLSMGEKGSTPSLSLQFESNGNPGAVGYDSTGGYSYGLFQMAHDNAKRFVDQSPYAKEFQGLAFNSPAWQSKWKEVAKKDPQGFSNAQEQFIQQTHVQPQIDKLMGAGLKVDQYSPALKQVIESTAVQHGANTDVITQALKGLPKNPSEDQLIKAIYKARWGGGQRFASSTPQVRKSVYNRFFGKNGEMQQALALAKQYNA